MRALLIGAAAALTAGMSAGAAMHPDLNVGDRPAGPQMFAAWSGERSTGPFDGGTSFASYKGQLPDYVIGTDWKKAMAPPPAERVMASPEDTYARHEIAAIEASLAATRTAYVEPPPAPAAYPSMSGGEAYGSRGPEAAEPARDEDAPPTVTG